MNNGELKQFIDLSRAIGQRPDFVQGAGGNVSIKIGDKMFIKASGWRLKDVSESDGLAIVDTVNNGNFGNLKPSMETEFHAFLEKYVIHTHPVYANIISCSVNGKKIWQDILSKIGALGIWVEYQSPGHYLAMAIKNVVEEFENQRGAAPEAILMQNHGLIVCGDNLDKIFNLHNRIQEEIKKNLNLKPFPQDLREYLAEFIKIKNNILVDFSKNILFPDQAVFCGNIEDKILINEETEDIIYKTSEKEASAIEENFVAWLYIVDCAKDCGLALNFLSQNDIDYINNMESEKYRKQLFKDN